MRYLNTKKENAMTTLFAKGKTLLALAVGFFAAVGILSLAHVGPAHASTSPAVNLAALVAQVSALQTRVAYLETHPTAGPTGDTGSQGPAGTAGTNGKDGAPGAQGSAGIAGTNGTNGKDGAPGSAGAGFTRDKIAILNAFSLSNGVGMASELTVTGVNVHIVNGLNNTETKNGRGNLIIGYNATGNDHGNGDVRTGSHNLILGGQNNYSSYGGFVAGYDNVISNRYASVSGGYYNRASGNQASISGGQSNTASGNQASVSGGVGNIASGALSSVSGGDGNTAIGDTASVSGGLYNMASGDYATVSGGYSITQINDAGWAGGSYHTP
jgi:hypothetical protein